MTIFLSPLALRASGSSWPFWTSYLSHFVNADGRVIDPDRNNMTTSEGQSYAMFFALVGNDEGSFERIRAWTESNLSHGSLASNLPSWSWGQGGDGGWRVLDSNSAADADLWIAYSLLQAGRLWQKPAYTASGKGLLSKIAQLEVATLPGAIPALMPGRVELFSSSGHWVINASYSPLPLLFAAAQAEPQGPWRKMALSLPELLHEGSSAGFAMDWVADTDGFFSATMNPGDLSHPPCGSYDAIRVYLWAGMTDRETPGAEKILQIFSPMAKWMSANAVPPEIVSPEGRILSRSGPVGFSAALVPFLLSSENQSAAKAQLQRIRADTDSATLLLGKRPRYYDQNLALFALGWQEQRFRFAANGELRVRWQN